VLIEFPRRFYVVSMSSSGGINGTPMFWHGYGRCGLPKNALAVAGLGSQGRLMGDLLTLTNTRLQVADNGNQAENWIAPTEFACSPSGNSSSYPTASKIGAGYAFQAVVWGNNTTKQALVEAQDLVRTGQTRVWPAREGSQDGEHTYLYLKSTSDSLALYFDAAAALPTF
jgi:hypothetical protein